MNDYFSSFNGPSFHPRTPINILFRRHEVEIAETIVCLDLVYMIDLHAIRDWSVKRLPDNTVHLIKSGFPVFPQRDLHITVP